MMIAFRSAPSFFSSRNLSSADLFRYAEDGAVVPSFFFKTIFPVVYTCRSILNFKGPALDRLFSPSVPSTAESRFFLRALLLHLSRCSRAARELLPAAADNRENRDAFHPLDVPD